MEELLNQVDDDLGLVESRLLEEFRRIRKMDSTEQYSKIDPTIRAELRQQMQDLSHQLDHSGDRNNLTLRTEKHENLYSRIFVTMNLLEKPVPTAFIEISRKEAAAKVAEQSEITVHKKPKRQARIEIDDDDEELGFFARLFGKKKKKPAPARSRITVTDDEEEQTASKKSPEVYLNKGAYAISQELASLNEQVVLHHDEGQSIEQVVQERAQFDSKDLSEAPVQAKKKKDIAQSPDEIRKKLEGKGGGASGASSFESKDIQSLNETLSDTTPKKKIAQTPEEIRKKLQEKGSTETKGASSFGAKDIQSEADSITAGPARKPGTVAQTPEEIRKKLAERQGGSSNPDAGKASFGAKDIAPVPEKKAKPKKIPDGPKPTGKATFESRDLTKKD